MQGISFKDFKSLGISFKKCQGAKQRCVFNYISML